MRYLNIYKKRFRFSCSTEIAKFHLYNARKGKCSREIVGFLVSLYKVLANLRAK